MKILSVNISDVNGGAARAAYRIHQAVNEIGIDGKMFVKTKGTKDNRVFEVSDFDKINLFSRSYRFIENKIKNKIQQFTWKPYPEREDVFMSDLRSSSIHGALQKIDFDILHLHWINLRFLDLNELKKVHKPIVWTLHDCWAFTGVCHYFYECERYKNACGKCPFLHSGNDNDLSHKIWQKKTQVYKDLDLHVVTPSKWLAESAKSSSLFQNFPVSVIPNPINSDIFLPNHKDTERKKLNLNADKTYILYGAMNAVKDRNKGFVELIRALKILENSVDVDNFELLVFGADKPIKELDIKMKVQYLGVLRNEEDIVSAYNAADVMVVPSLSENLSNAIMESLSCGTPVVAFNIGGNSDMIDHKQNGFLAEKLNVNELAEGILWCIENNKDFELSKFARKKVLENYTKEKVGQQYTDLYKKLI